jgi:dipeptidyl aminopeptidase/acylaminoacyl peptidase
LINRLIAAGKDYDLLLFPDERHSPRRLRDRIYMEQRISDYFLKNLSLPSFQNQATLGAGMLRTMAGL